MSSNSQTDPAAAAAAQAALLQFVTEDWTLFSIGLTFTIIRTYARVKHVGFRGLQLDDYFVWVAMIFYAVETSLAYSVGAVAQGLANNGMTDAQRVALDPSSQEYQLRVVGSKIQLAGWSTYCALLWSLKTSLLVFYIRLTEGLSVSYTVRIYVGFVFLGASWFAAMMTLFLGCRPFHKYWQINPDPGNACQPAVASQIVWVFCAMNVVTDLYLISIPIPMLWKSSLKPLKKVGLISLFSGGFFIITCALIRAVLIVTDPVNGAQVAGSWAVRETFVSVITTNLPMVFPLVRSLLAPVFGSLVSSVRNTSSKKSTDKGSKGLITFGGGGDDGWRHRGPSTANPITELTYNESEERILNQGNIKMQDLSNDPSIDRSQSRNSSRIRKDVHVDVTSVPSGDVRQQSRGEGNYAFASGPGRAN
ncbi:hypothetical protein F4809DRAFT_652025 [Biscogniauxia mediterranea]|nr:hypothetical protein F4809DRAFT_652025 [Biscogniauxia mediterranea]